MQNILFSIIFFILSSLFVDNVYAEQQTDNLKAIGSVVAARGEVKSENSAGISRTLAMKDQIFREDTIKTGNNGRVQILFEDKTIISLGPKSNVKISEYRWNQDKQEGAIKTKIKEGIFRYMGGAITKVAPEKFITETPTATIGIRGSMFAGKVDEGMLSVMFQGGRGIYVANDFGSVTISTPGFGTRVEGFAAGPLAPYRFSGQELKDLTVDPAGNGKGEGKTDGNQKNEKSENTSEDQEQETTSPEETSGQPIQESSREPIIATPDVPNPADPSNAPPSPIPSPVVFNTTGKYMAVQTDLNAATSSGDAFWNGDNNPTFSSANNTVSGKPTIANGDFSYSLNTQPYNPSASYSYPPTKSNPVTGRSLNLLGTDYIFQPTDTEIFSTNIGDFLFFKSHNIFTAFGKDYDFLEFGFSGVKSEFVPTEGINYYKGEGLKIWIETAGSGNINPSFDKFYLGVNWHNGKVFGALDSPSSGPPTSPTLFFYGDATAGADITNMKVIGNYPGPSGILSFSENTETFGQFYGDTNNGIGITCNLLFSDISSTPAFQGRGIATAGAFKGDLTPQPSPTGTIVWNGFVSGLSERVVNPNASPRRLFVNNMTSDFSMTINRDSGTLNGSITAYDQIGGRENKVNNLEIGGDRGSVYIADYGLLGILGCSSPTCIEINPARGDIKPLGNYLVVAEPGNNIAKYVSWGYWEISYQDPADLNHYRLNNNSLWIAGELTPTSFIDGLIASNYTANYIGNAQGNWIQAGNSVTRLTNGQTNLTLNFSNTAPVPVDGKISFTEVTLSVHETANHIGNSGFSANINNPDAIGKINGAFFGPNAESIGGTFDANISGDHYNGIFGGNK